MVIPIISGITVEARAQVFITVFSPEELTFFTFSINFASQ
jgi:hypothetical protein